MTGISDGINNGANCPDDNNGNKNIQDYLFGHLEMFIFILKEKGSKINVAVQTVNFTAVSKLFFFLVNFFLFIFNFLSVFLGNVIV